MPLTEIIPLVVLLVMFVVATKWPLNIGVMGLVASFFVGYFVLGMDDKEILKEFPASIVMTIIGVTYFFSMAQRNGTIDMIVHKCIAAVRGRDALMPWIFFLLASFLTALGTFSPAAVALLAPAAMTFAHRARYSPVAVGALVINGAHAGGFSPISVAGVLVSGIASKNHQPIGAMQLFLSSYAINLILSVLTVVIFAAVGRLRDRRGDEHGDDLRAAADAHETTRMQILTLGLIGAVIVAALVFKLPIGFVALTAGLVLAFCNISEHKSYINGVSWSTVLLVAGMITYVSLLEHAGVIDTMADTAVHLGTPLVVALILCLIIGVSSAFASSTALLTAFIPLAMPLLQASDLSAMGVIAALAISATIVDVSPFSTDGALIVANAQGEHATTIYRRLMGYAAAVVVAGPVLAWLLLVPTGII